MPTLVTKDCKFLHARTRRYFKKIEEDTHTTFFVDGKIAGRISDEESGDVVKAWDALVRIVRND